MVPCKNKFTKMSLKFAKHSAICKKHKKRTRKTRDFSVNTYICICFCKILVKLVKNTIQFHG